MTSISQRSSPTSISLSTEMKEIILNDTKKLEDEHMNKFCAILKETTGFEMKTTLLYQVPELITPIEPQQKHIQILFAYNTIDDGRNIDYNKTQDGHWICSYYENQVIHIYDSINKKSLDKTSSIFLKKLIPFKTNIIFHEVQNQKNAVDCGIFAIAFAVSLSLGKDPSMIVYDESKLRSHLYQILVNDVYEHFPYINNNEQRQYAPESHEVRRQRLKNLNRIENNMKRSNEKIESDRIKENERKRKIRNDQSTNKTDDRRIVFQNQTSNSSIKQRGGKSDKWKTSQIYNKVSLKEVKINPVASKNRKFNSRKRSHRKKLDNNQSRDSSTKNETECTTSSKLNVEQRQIMQCKNISKNNSAISPFTNLLVDDNPKLTEITSDEHTSDSISTSNNSSNSDDNSRIRRKKSKLKKRKRRKVNHNYFMAGLNDINSIDENLIDEHYIGKMDVVCESCNSLNFEDERPFDKKFSKCCHKGKVKLSEIEDYPDLLKELLTSKSKYSKHFKENIRSYNNSLAFASMGAKLDILSGKGPFVFRIHGQIYHNTFAMHPNEGGERKYGQLYVIDSKQANSERLKKKSNSKCDKTLLSDLDKLIRDINPFANAFKMMADLEREEQEKAELEHRMIKPIYMWITRDRRLDKNRYNLPNCNEVALIFVGDDGQPPIDRDICIHPKGEKSISISTLSSNVDPMTYPLLFPRGEKGWTIGIKHSIGNRDVTPLQYYSYRLSWRGHFNPCLQAANLTQQYIVDMWSKIEGERLKYIRQEQKTLRSEMYSGLMDYLYKLNDDSSHIRNPGKVVILPSSFQTSPRAYQQLYLDAMSLVQKYGKPQLFITMTCNPQWKEISENLNEGETASDRPDLVTRVFHLKLDRLKKLLFSDQIFGTYTAYIYVIEFQKRGLPHAHLLLFLHKEYMIRDAETIDKFISAEIPDKNKNPHLYEVVKKFMVHGPCGEENRNAPCMDPDTNKCTKNFPKEFSEITTITHNSYPIYKRPNNGRVICYKSNNTIKLARNNYIVPYNPFLSLHLNCHCNVEVCSTVTWIKYLFKYCYKGHDCALVEITREHELSEFQYDEIHQYLSTRYVCPPEAMHRILELKLHEQSHAVVRLAVHLEQQELVYFHEGLEEKAIENHKNTTLTAWFKLNQSDENAREYLYVEIVDHYTFNQKNKVWNPRIRNKKPVISRMYFVSPKEIERYNLRLLLLHVRGAQCFDDLKTYEGITYKTFTEAAKMRNLIENDDEVEKCLDEAINFKFPDELCRLFGYICVFCLPHNLNFLWDKYKEFFCDPKKESSVAENLALRNVQEILTLHGFTLEHFGLPSINDQMIWDYERSDEISNSKKLYVGALKNEIIKMKGTFNEEQSTVFNAVMGAIKNNSIKKRYFYIDGPGGCGKSYLLNAIITMIESEGRYVISVASTGIAANLLRNGSTVHSMFKLPMALNETSTCNISRSSNHANLIKKADLIIWDEITMSTKYALQAIDIFLRDLMENKLPFGGKVIVLSGDWRQILPVVRRGNRTMIVEECIKKSDLWKNFKNISLTINQRVDNNQKEFMDWLLTVGNGSANQTIRYQHDIIEIPNDLLTVKCIVQEIYDNIIKKDDNQIHNYTILAPLNADVFDINNEIIKKVEGHARQYLSIDINDTDEEEFKNSIPIEFLNSITPNGFPLHNLVLKIGAVVMLLRNLNINNGLCNGTRLVITEMLDHLLIAQILTGRCTGQNVLLPRIKFVSVDDELPFRMIRKQFPIRLAYAMTINKAQGQTFEKVGIYLRNKVFSHGQLYVALSRVRKKENLKIYITENGICAPDNAEKKKYTKNVVYKEIIT